MHSVGSKRNFYEPTANSQQPTASSQQPTANSQQRSVIARFKRACVNFCKGIGGFGVIEAAFTLPIFIGITFAVIDYGMMMSNRSSAAGNISSLTRTIQDNPNIPAEQLNTLVTNAGGGSVNFNTHNSGNCFCAQSFTTQAAAQAFVNDTGCRVAACGTGRNTLGGNPRWVGVRGQVTYKFITPVNKIFVGEPTKVLKFGQVVPVGITVCPVGQALTSAGVCAASTATCGAGQFLTASGTCSAAVPVCNQPGKALQFDGANWSCISVLSNLEIYEAQQRECYRDDNEHQVVATCPSGYGLLGCGGGPGDMDGYGEYWVLRPDFPSNRCIGIVNKPRDFGAYWSCTYVSASCYKKN